MRHSPHSVVTTTSIVSLKVSHFPTKLRQWVLNTRTPWHIFRTHLTPPLKRPPVTETTPNDQVQETKKNKPLPYFAREGFAALSLLMISRRSRRRRSHPLHQGHRRRHIHHHHSIAGLRLTRLTTRACFSRSCHTSR